jgi:hypothetical protein
MNNYTLMNCVSNRMQINRIHVNNNTHMCKKLTKKRMKMIRLPVKFTRMITVFKFIFLRYIRKSVIYVPRYDFHKHECDVDSNECDFYRQSVIFTHRVCLQHAECDFHVYECDFHTHTCDYYSITRTRVISRGRIQCSHVKVYTQSVIFTCMNVILIA